MSDSTGDTRADKVVRGLAGLLERVFPGRVRGIYLRGSYATGTSHAGSDLDLFVIFAGEFAPGEQRQARHICESCALLTPMLLEVIVSSESQLREPEEVVLASNLKLGTRLLFGDDIRDHLPEMEVGAYTRAIAHTPLYSYMFPTQRRNSTVLKYPLDQLDADDPFCGYGQWLMPGDDGEDRPSTKLLIATVGWTATAIVVLRTGRYVRDKAASADLYTRHIADHWTDFVIGVHEKCRNQWHYRIPTVQADRDLLQGLCRRVADFQNHYLLEYRAFQLRELGSDVPARRALAARRLGQVVFHDPDVIDALRTHSASDNEEVRSSASAALARYETP